MPQKRFFMLKKWRGSLKIIAILGILYLLFLAISSLFANSSTETYIEVFVGDWLKYGNDSKLQPIFNVLHSSEPAQYIPKESVVSIGQGIKVDTYVPNCGMENPCPSGEFAVHVYTGKDHNDQPRLCVDGKYVIEKNVNSGGRGINVAIVDTLTKSVTHVTNFDTYEHESTQLETLLLTLRNGDMLIMLTFDEPTKMLSRVAKLLFHDLGSGLAQNLQYRASWYLITQKGISGFAPYEGLNLIESDGWPVPHDRRLCVPLQLKGQAVHPDPLPRLNPPRQEFCRKHEGFPIFCDGDVVNDPLLASVAHRSGLAGSDVFSLPVIVMSGENVTYLPVTLETVIRQPGINPKNVVVYYLPRNPQVPEMADLFGFMSEELSSNDRCAQVVDAFETTSLLFPDAKALLFLESNVILSPDFLSYMGQTLPLLAMDSSLHFISAWNDNGFEEVSGVPDLLYRVRGVGSLALLIRKKAVSKDLCRRRSREDWLVEGSEDVIVPDLSRVLYIPTKGAANRVRNTSMQVSYQYLHRLFTSCAMHCRFSEIRLQDVQSMAPEVYNMRLRSDLRSAVALPLDYPTLEQCVAARDADEGYGLYSLIQETLNSTGPPLAIYYHQSHESDFSVISRLCYCLGLYSQHDGPPRGIYQGILRFSWSGRLVYLVSSLSPHYTSKPPQLAPIAFV